MRKFRKYTATALVAMMVAGMTMSGYQPADVSASQESEYIIVTKDKKSMKTVESKYNTMIDTQEQNTDLLKDENVLVSKMTAKEADIVNKDQKVVSVEKNTMVNASETESTTAAKEDQGTDSQWNLKSIHVDKAKDTATDEKVKVALLDSGIDFQEGLNVNEMTERYGFSAYNYGCNWQFLNTTTLFFEDALRTQSPKVILIETFNVDKVHEDTDLNGEIYYTKGISDFKGKREYLAQCFGKNKDRYLSYYIPLLAFHENWTNVNYYSFDSGTSVEEYQAAHGFSGSDHIVPTVISNPATFEQKELPDSSVRLLDKIVNICNENNIRLIFYTVPYEGEYNYSDAMAEYAAANNCTYLNLFEHMDDVGLNGDTDFMDIEHLNISGATKVADYLGEYIVSHNLLSETN